MGMVLDTYHISQESLCQLHVVRDVAIHPKLHITSLVDACETGDVAPQGRIQGRFMHPVGFRQEQSRLKFWHERIARMKGKLQIQRIDGFGRTAMQFVHLALQRHARWRGVHVDHGAVHGCVLNAQKVFWENRAWSVACVDKPGPAGRRGQMKCGPGASGLQAGELHSVGSTLRNLLHQV